MIKNIILTSAIDNENYKGMVTLENTSEKTLVTLKTYNLPKTENKRVLGVLIDGDLYKVSINENESYVIDKKTDLNNKISVVLLEIQNMTSKILIWGSNETSRVWQNSVTFNFELENEKLNSNEKENNIQINNNIDNIIHKEEKDLKIATNFIEKVYSETKKDDYESDEYIENLVTQNLRKENFIEEYESFNEEIVEENVKEETSDNKSEFFASIESQIDELLTTYEEEKALEEIIPNSKFVKVDLEKNGNFYIFGVIYEDKNIKYIVYGLPGEYSVKPDDEYSKFYQWLPLNQENPEGYGYYLMYQDANNGNQIEMIIEEK